MNILGISCYYHDAAAALVCDGEIEAAVQEERFTRKKHDFEFPVRSIRYCLEKKGIRSDALDAVVFYEKPLLKFERILETYLYCAPSGIASFIKAMTLWTKKKLWIASEIRKRLDYSGPLYFSDHHMSHAASAFYPSPFREAAIVTADGVGEWTTTSIGSGKDARIDIVKEIRFPHSLGLLYSAFTYYTGFKVNSGEYKVMGLAPYGEGKYVDAILEHLVDLKDDGSFRLNMEYFNYLCGLTMTGEKFHRLFGGPPRVPESPVTRKEMDLARSVQIVIEMAMERMVAYALDVTGCDRLCLAGGVALNCVANGKIVRKLPVRDVFVQPAAGDAGGALGAALFGWYRVFEQPRDVDERTDSQKGSFLGPEFTVSEIEAFLKEKAVPYTELSGDAVFTELAKLLAGENVIGVFQGRMEYGPRALGARSILGDARSPSMQRKMNLKIKFRESFRPFAPIVLEDDFREIFDAPFTSPYMLLVGDVLDAHRIRQTGEQKALFGIERLNVPRSHIPAVTHVDYSARLQTVSESVNPFCYRLLKAFKRLTGVGVLVNTSFNVRGEPIVCSPEDAYRCFMRTEMDYLLLDRFLLKKTDQPSSGEGEEWKREFEPD
jgi:carbamoyltransferase